jgi:hypothetical protein
MSWFSSLLGRRFEKRVFTPAKRQAARKNRLRTVLEQLERRDVPSTFLQVVSTPNYPTMGQFDAVSVTVNGTQYPYAGIQFGAKLASNPSDLPGNGVPDFYAFCVDITAPANLSSSYQVATTPASTLPNGGAIAYLYDMFNSAVSSPLNKTQAAGLQLAIWEEEYSTNIVTSNDVSFMDNYNGSAETTNLIKQANSYLSMVPSNPTGVATVYKSASSDDQSLIGPPDTIVTTQQPAMAAAGTLIADQALVSGINPTGTVTFNLYNNPTASGTPLFTDTETLSGGVATSKGYTPTASGTDYWVATYNGDANNLPVTGSPTAEPVSVVNALINITPLTPVNPVGSPEVFTVTATAFPNGTGTPSFGQLNVTVTGGITPSISGPSISGNTATWSVTINSKAAGTFTVQASDTVTMDGIDVTRTTGDNFTGADGSDSPSAVKNYVDALISITPLTPVNPVNSPEMFTVTVTAFPGTTGMPNFGTLNVTVTGDITPTISGPTLSGNMATWTVTINSNASGTFNVQARDTVTMGGVTITRTTGDGYTGPDGSDSASAVKNYVDALIAISPLTPVNPLNAPEKFTITVTAFPAGTTGTPSFTLPIVTFPVTGPPGTVGPVMPLSGPTLQADGTYIETWTETINSSVPGTFNVRASDMVTMGGVVITRTTGDNFTDPDGSDSPSAVKKYIPGLMISTTQQPATAAIVSTNGGTASATIADQATVSGGTNPTGTVTFVLLSNPHQALPPLFTDTETLSNGMATSKGYTATVSGTDYWVATYNGDTQNMSVTSGPTDEPVNVIDALISISPLKPVNPINAPETFTITVTAFPGSTGTPMFATPTVTFPGGGPGTQGAVLPLSGPTLQADGSYVEKWTETINSAVAGWFNVQASDTVTMGGVAVTRTTGDGFTSSDGSDSPSALKNYVNATIAITPLTPVNPVKSPEMFTVTATGYPAITGTPSFGQLIVTVTGGLTPTISNPTLSGNTATWTVTINSDAAGTFTVTAMDTITMGGLAITRTTGDNFTSGDGNDSPSAVKNYVDALIAISPLTPVNPLNAPEKFTITVTAFPAGTTGTPSFTLPTVTFPVTGPPGTVGLVTPLSGPNLQPDGTYIETWTETINSSVPGMFNVRASDMVTMGGVTITRTTGDNFTDPDGSDSPSAVKTYVSTIAITTTPSIITTNTPSITTTPSVSTPPAACNDTYYPTVTNDPLTNVPFNESQDLIGTSPSDGTSISLQDGRLQVFYSDEHALTLGVSQITMITSSGTTTTNYPVSALPASPSSVTNPQVGAPYTPPASPVTVQPGTLALQGGTDTAGRPLAPSLYITDITGLDPNGVAAHAGDWQYGGSPIAPSAIYGTWKSVTETINMTGNTPQIMLNTSNDPQQNGTNLGAGADPIPSGAQTQGGYTAEAAWNVNSLGLIPGHSYRFYVMVHDGDQNKQGGDVGQACVDLLFTGSAPSSSNTLNDSATLSNANNAKGNITFYLFAPGVTPASDYSNNVYTDVVPVSGNGTYTTAMGNNPGGYAAAGAGVYQWVAVYGGDGNNASVTSPFGSEPSMVAVPPCPDNLYPYSSSNPLTGVAFNESAVFAGSTPADGTSISMQNGHIDVFYNDERAMTLGVSQISTKTSSGTTTQNFNVSSFSTADSGGAGVVTSPQVGAPYTPPASPVSVSPSTLALQGGTDPSGRPMFPSLFVTDITNNLNSTAGDWQQGGTPIAPSAVYGTWKSITETIDETNPSNPQIQFSVNNDPQQNKWDLGPGADPVPASVVAASQGQGYSAELQWNLNSLNLTPGHTYRFYVIIHDGDQNKAGGDTGQGCVNLVFSGNGPVTPTPNTGSSSGTIAKLNDSATLSGGSNPTGTITFYLLPPGSTASTPLSAAVYTNVVSVNGNGTYSTTTGSNPGGYVPTATGTYQWVAVYSGDGTNPSVTSPFGSEPQTVQGMPSIAVVKTADAASILSGQKAGFTVTITNNGNATDTGVTLSDPLPAGSGGDVNWTIDTTTGNPADFAITGSMGAQSLILSPAFIAAGDSLAPGQSITVHITSPTNAGDATGGMAASANSFDSTGTAAAGLVTLGTAGNYALLGLQGTKINLSAATVYGNAGVSQGGSLSNNGSSTITGNLDQSQAGQYSRSGSAQVLGSVITNSSLLAQNDADALAAAAAAKALAPTQTFGTISLASSQTMTVQGNGGLNVIQVNGSIGLSGSSQLILNGSASDVFIFNVTGNTNISGSSVLGKLSGGVTANHVLYNFTGSGSLQAGAGNTFFGTFLAPNYSYGIEGNYAGELIIGGQSVALASGAKVFSAGARLVNTATVSASNVSAQQSTATITVVGAVPQLAKGAGGTTAFSELLDPTSTLKPGAIKVAVNLPAGPLAVAEAAAIRNVLATYNAQLKPYGVSFVWVTGAQAATAQVHIGMAASTPLGGVAQGVLGDFSVTTSENITLVQGWNWYFGNNPAKIGAKQYDFQSVVAHELGHALGLGENLDPYSSMDLYLASGEVSRYLAPEDLAAIAQELARKSVAVATSSAKTGSGK